MNTKQFLLPLLLMSNLDKTSSIEYKGQESDTKKLKKSY